MGLKATAPGIPTDYSGYRFRSRGEAGWAAFFHLLGWNWRYEPVDLAGYIPDFVVPLDFPLLVEVKPAYTLDQLLSEGGDARKKIEKTGWRSRALLVGAHPVDTDEGTQDCLGLVGVPHGGAKMSLPDHLRPVPFTWRPCRLMWCAECSNPSLYIHGAPPHSCTNRHCGKEGCLYPLNPHQLYTMWALAWNMVRWNGKAPSTVRGERHETRPLFA